MMGDLSALHDQAWDLLTRGPVDPTAPSRLISLATTGRDDAPRSRMVVLRGVDRARHELRVYSDSRASKCAELARTPAAALLVWDPAQSLQLRLCARCELRDGTEVEWDAMPPSGRALYGGQPSPGAPLPDPQSFHPSPSRAQFMVLTFAVQSLDVLYLGRDDHRRALYEQHAGWAGRWIAP